MEAVSQHCTHIRDRTSKHSRKSKIAYGVDARDPRRGLEGGVCEEMQRKIWLGELAEEDLIQAKRDQSDKSPYQGPYDVSTLPGVQHATCNDGQFAGSVTMRGFKPARTPLHAHNQQQQSQ